MKQLLQKLCEPCSISGHSQEAAKLVKQLVSPFCDRTEIDPFGNVIGFKRGVSGKTILLESHMDEVGLQVKHIRPDGGLEVISVGGLDTRILPCSEVLVHGKRKLYGVIGAKPPHLLGEGEEKGEMKLSDLVVDVGMKDPREFVKIGDAVTFLPVFREQRQGRVSCKGLDNKCGVATMLYVMQSLKNSPHNLVFLASTAEEMGCLGAAAVMETTSVDLAIVTDVTFGLTPDEDESLCFALGSGAAICTGANIHPDCFSWAVKTAKKNRIPYQIEVEAGDTGTNAGVIQLSGRGVPTLLISVPLRYMHTMVETIQLSDMEAAANLIIALAGGELPC